MRLREVLERVGLGRTTVRERIKRDQFPKPVKIGTLDAWVESEITEWIEARIQERDRAA